MFLWQWFCRKGKKWLRSPASKVTERNKWLEFKRHTLLAFKDQAALDLRHA